VWVPLLAFACGAGALQWQPSLPSSAFYALLPLLASVVFLPRRLSGPWPAVRLAGVALLAAALGFSWAAWRAELRLAERLPETAGGMEVSITGRIDSLPERDARGERFDFALSGQDAPAQAVPTRIRLTWPNPVWGSQTVPHRVRAGELWRFTVRLYPPHGQANPGGFDYEAWMLQQNLGAVGSVRVSPPPQRLALRAPGAAAWLLDQRERLRERIAARVPAAQAGLLTALTVGDQDAIPAPDWRIFNRTGTTHLVSISGLHVTLLGLLAGTLAGFVWRRVPGLTLRIPARRVALWVGLVTALGYAVLAGFGVPAQRTVFMLCIVVVLLGLGRSPSSWLVWLLALCGVLLIDPWAVLAAGFWLSFLAVGVILFLLSAHLRAPGKLRGWLGVQLGITLVLSPLLLVWFGQLSLVSPLANALAIPVLGWGVVPLALGGMAWSPLWEVAAWLLQGTQSVLQMLADWPWAAWRLAPPGWAAMLLGLAGGAWLLMPRGFPWRWLGGLMLLPMILPRFDVPGPGEFVAEIMDVGQGTAVIVRTAQHAMLVDAGPAYGESDAGERVLVPRLAQLGVSRLDVMLLSHNDLDHTGGAASVLRDVPIRRLLTSFEPGAAALPAALRCVRGQQWQWDGVHFAVLNPPDYAYTQKNRRDNDASCVLRVSNAAGSLLLPGDAERIGELEMTEAVASQLHSSVVLASHHGSRTSSIAPFVSAVAPRWVIYTVGTRNRFGHPHPQVVARWQAAGATALRTDQAGMIQLRVGMDGLRLTSWRKQYLRYWQSGQRDVE
jgi:competence protein ComEC